DDLGRPRRRVASVVVHPYGSAAEADADHGADRCAARRGLARPDVTRLGREPYLERLATRSSSTGTVLCLGLDPDPAALPDGFSPDLAGVEAFCRLVLEAALPMAAAVKPNLAFYEAFGSVGLAALERLRALIPDDVPVVIDAKRGDVPNTSERIAVALFDRLGADAVTVNPYLGEAGLAPLLERADR